MSLSWWRRLMLKRWTKAATRGRPSGRPARPRPTARILVQLEDSNLPSVSASLSGTTVLFKDAVDLLSRADLYLRTTSAGALEWSTDGSNYTQDVDSGSGGLQTLNIATSNGAEIHS